MAVKDLPRDRSLNMIDQCTLGYIATVALLVLLFHSRIPRWPLQLLLDIAMAAIVFLIAWAVADRPSASARLVRHLYPMALFLPMYEQTGSMNHIVFPAMLNALFSRVEESVFGFQPAIEFARRFPQPWFAEYLHFAYSTYYFLFPGLGVFLCLRRTKAELIDYMLSLCGVMYVCYLFYIFLPVEAPCFEIGFAPASGPFTWIMTWIYLHLEVQGAAFPSSHVAAAATVLYYTFRSARAALWIVAPLAISLMAATVYCRYHYAIDVPAGLATAMILIPVIRKFNPELRRPSLTAL